MPGQGGANPVYKQDSLLIHHQVFAIFEKSQKFPVFCHSLQQLSIRSFVRSSFMQRLIIRSFVSLFVLSLTYSFVFQRDYQDPSSTNRKTL